jgi:hypothetical protein
LGILFNIAALTVDMDPCPRIPLRPGEGQNFLISLSQAGTSCNGTISFNNLPTGLTCVPQTQNYTISPGQEKLLVFEMSSSMWAESTAVRPAVTVSGGESVNFPDSFVTQIMRDSVYYEKLYNMGNRTLKNNPLDPQGFMAYWSCGDFNATEYRHWDQCAGANGFWEEGVWYHEGGIKGRAACAYNGKAFPLHRWSKIAYEPLNVLDYRRGTIMCWFRKTLNRIKDMEYAGSFNADPANTWQIGPNGMNGVRGEGLVGWQTSPQQIYTKWYLRHPDWRTIGEWKPSSNSYISLRRYKSVPGVTEGYLEAVYLAMRGDKYHVQAPFDWTETWRHVALVWDTEAPKLEIWIDGQLASGPVKKNGSPSTDTIWYGCPWDVVTFCNSGMSIINAPAEGGQSTLDRDEYYIYNRALNQTEIQANRQKSVGQVVAPEIVPGTVNFYGSHKAEIRSLWTNAEIRYTTNGNDPTQSSTLYSGPFTVTSTTTIKARSYVTGFTASDIVSAVFTRVAGDTIKPKVNWNLSLNNPNELMLFFSKPVEAASATNTSNYTISGGVNVTNAALDSDNYTVRLTLGGAVTGSSTISISNVRDRTASPNTMNDQTGMAVNVRDYPGLIGYWSFDVLKGTTVKDLSANPVHGTGWHGIYEGITRVQGHNGSGVYLDGEGDMIDLSVYSDPYITLDQNYKLNNEVGTASIWFRADLDIPDYKRHILYTHYAYDIHCNQGNLGIGSISQRFDTGVRVKDMKWHHAVLTFQRGVADGCKIYVDGILRDSRQLTFLNGHIYNGLGIGVGGGAYGQPRYFKGAVDEVMMFDRVLSAGEAAALFQDEALVRAREQNMVKTVEPMLAVSPNPFSSSVNIAFISNEEKVKGKSKNIKMDIYDIRGKLVKSLVNDVNKPSTYNVVWNGSDEKGRAVSSGLYMVRMTTGNVQRSMKVLLSR